MAIFKWIDGKQSLSSIRLEDFPENEELARSYFDNEPGSYDEQEDEDDTSIITVADIQAGEEFFELYKRIMQENGEARSEDADSPGDGEIPSEDTEIPEDGKVQSEDAGVSGDDSRDSSSFEDFSLNVRGYMFDRSEEEIMAAFEAGEDLEHEIEPEAPAGDTGYRIISGEEIDILFGSRMDEEQGALLKEDMDRTDLQTEEKPNASGSDSEKKEKSEKKALPAWIPARAAESITAAGAFISSQWSGMTDSVRSAIDSVRDMSGHDLNYKKTTDAKPARGSGTTNKAVAGLFAMDKARTSAGSGTERTSEGRSDSASRTSLADRAGTFLKRLTGEKADHSRQVLPGRAQSRPAGSSQGTSEGRIQGASPTRTQGASADRTRSASASRPQGAAAGRTQGVAGSRNLPARRTASTSRAAVQSGQKAQSLRSINGSTSVPRSSGSSRTGKAAGQRRPGPAPSGRSRPQKKKPIGFRIAKLVFFLIVWIVVFVFCMKGYKTAYNLFYDLPMDPGDMTKVSITLTGQETDEEVGQWMLDNGLIDDLDLYLLRCKVYSSKYKPGTYKLSKSYNTEKNLNILAGYKYSEGKMEEDEETETADDEEILDGENAGGEGENAEGGNEAGED
ncbi:MAG: hypothetical protein ACOX75_00515 [Lachnospiraceae bacterium]|jgi:hypothetical protein